MHGATPQVEMAVDSSRASKRRKLDSDPQHPDGDIRGAFELHNLLRFKQSIEPEVKAGAFTLGVCVLVLTQVQGLTASGDF